MRGREASSDGRRRPAPRGQEHVSDQRTRTLCRLLFEETLFFKAHTMRPASRLTRLAGRLCSAADPMSPALHTSAPPAAAALARAPAAPAALVYASHGPPETCLALVPQALSEPATAPPPPGTARVRWLLAPVNWSDVNVVEGSYPGAPAPPATPGNEGVGVVMAVGPRTADDADAGGGGGSGFHRPLAPGDFVVPLAPGAGTWRSVGEVATAALWRVEGLRMDGDGRSGGGGSGRGLTLDQAATLCIK